MSNGTVIDRSDRNDSVTDRGDRDDTVTDRSDPQTDLRTELTRRLYTVVPEDRSIQVASLAMNSGTASIALPATRSRFASLIKSFSSITSSTR